MSAHLKAEIHVIRQSGLFFSAWYLAQHPQATEDGVEHFCATGWREGARPNPYFDPHWYLYRNPEVAAAGANPLLHYIVFGEVEGRDPSPFFHVNWYRETYNLGAKEPCLKHYLDRRLSGQVSPVPLFDAAYYLENNRDVAEGSADPFEHFLVFGVKEARNPSAEFDTGFYTNRYGKLLGGENPLLHYLANKDSGLFMPLRPEQEGLVSAAVRRATRPAPYFEEVAPAPSHAPRKATLLAYYLPQFHKVPENDIWWGKGFTDWTNLARALPRFIGHVQPRVPRDLGYYSLDNPDTLKHQIELAKGAGISGFVFYTYWFNRHRLLEKPLEQFLADKALDFSFCAMWANENWTRRWDGLEREVLIAQEYLEADDPALVSSFARLFEDARYIRVQGRPLLMIYRPGLIPDATARIAKWRRLFEELHGERPLLVMAQSLGDEYDPEPFGLDGAVEFPPHKLSQSTKRINDSLDLLDPDFSGTVHDYADIAATSLRLPVPDYPLIKTIVPGWDNDPRREGKGLALHNATPARYQAWLEELIGYTEKHPFFGEKLICINAWNEWAEGAYLEPDLHAGGAYLNATARAVCERETATLGAGILLVGHDAQAHGAQLLLLNIARRLRRQWGIKVHLLLLGVGPLLGPYYEAAEVQVAYDKTIIGNLLDKYRAQGIRTAIVNSAASSRVVPWLEARGISATLLIHELPQLLKEYNLEIQARLGGAAATNLVFSSSYVEQKFTAAVNLPAAHAVVLPQGNYQALQFDAAARRRTRRALGVEDEQFLVLGAGFGHIRKGFDLFLQLARKVAALRGDVLFVWVGDIEATLRTYMLPEMEALAAAGRFVHIPFTARMGEYFSAADVLALTSREDPLPTVVMEALGCGVPCVAFEDSGGIPELLRREKAGRVAHPADVEDFLAELMSLLDHEKLEAWRPRLAAMADQRFDFSTYVDQLLALAEPTLKRVSVAVLNYNYERYLPGRLASVFGQTYPVQEILLLDDASTDDSVEAGAKLAEEAGRELRVIANAKNAGVFTQWRRAAEEAQGEFVWLAEADDEADPRLLARLLEEMTRAPHALLGFVDSRAIDETGAQVMPSYQSYYFDSGAKGLMASGVWPARAFAEKFLTRRNLIPNVSAILWRRTALLAALNAAPDLKDWKLAGDWRLYLALTAAQQGEVVFVAEPLNTHRRHSGGVTQSLNVEAHIEEISRAQALAAAALDLGKTDRAGQAEDLARVAAKLRGTAPKKPKVARTKKT